MNAASSTNAVLTKAQFHLVAVANLCDTNQLKWTSVSPPNPDAMRVFECSTAKYRILICQANTKEHGIVHEGILTALQDGPMVIHIPPHAADRMYHLAAAQQN